jgi:methionyl-tRNA formyltransferase
MRLAYAGTAAFGVAVLEGLLASEHEVVVTVTTPDKPRGRRGTAQPSECKQAALARGLPVLQPEELSAPGSSASPCSRPCLRSSCTRRCCPAGAERRR